MDVTDRPRRKLFQFEAARFILEQLSRLLLIADHRFYHIARHLPHMARELPYKWTQRVVANTQEAAPRRSRNHLADLASVTGKEGVIDMSRVKTMLPVFGGLLYVVLSVLFGSLWYAALSIMMTRIAP
jgi:hypothetical protein